MSREICNNAKLLILNSSIVVTRGCFLVRSNLKQSVVRQYLIRSPVHDALASWRREAQAVHFYAVFEFYWHRVNRIKVNSYMQLGAIHSRFPIFPVLAYNLKAPPSPTSLRSVHLSQSYWEPAKSRQVVSVCTKVNMMFPSDLKLARMKIA